MRVVGEAVRVLLWGEQFWPHIGGAELFSARLMERLRGRGYEFAVVTSRASDPLPAEDSFDGIPVYRFPFRDALESRRVDEMLELRHSVTALVRRLRVDVILLTGVTPSAFFCMAAAEATGTPMLVRLNQEVGGRSARADGNTLTRHVLCAARWVTAVSQVILSQWLRLAPEVASRCSVIYSGVRAPEIRPASPSDPGHILCLGRLVHKKGFDVALESFAGLLDRWPQARLTIAGDGPERAALEAQAAELGVASHVAFPGWIHPDEVSSLIRSASLVLIPSRSEGLPGVALQAAAAARPVVATRRGGLPEVVVDGQTGLLSDLDAGAIGAAISSLLERPEVAASLGCAAWERARTIFSESACVDSYDALLRQTGRTGG